MKTLFNIGAFFFSALMPFADLPAVEIRGVTIGYAALTIVPIVLYFTWQLIGGQISIRSLSGQGIGWLYVTFIVALVLTLLKENKSVSIEFCVWFALNMVYLLSLIHIDCKWAIRGVLVGQTFNAVYLLLQNYFYPYIWVPESYFDTFSVGQLRSAGLMGEPSHVAILLVPTLAYICEYMRGWLGHVLSALFSIAIFFTYSGATLIAVAFFSIFYGVRNPKKFFDMAGLWLFLGMTLSVLQHPLYYGIPEEGPGFLTAWRKTDVRKSATPMVSKKSGKLEASKNRRTLTDSAKLFVRQQAEHEFHPAAFKKGVDLFLRNPLGVGPGDGERHLGGSFHNLFLEVAVELGLFGFFAFCAFLFTLSVTLMINGHWPLLGILGSMLVPMQLAQNLNMPGVWITLGICLALGRRSVSPRINFSRERIGKMIEISP